jgi:hypothetical protein
MLRTGATKMVIILERFGSQILRNNEKRKRN